MKYKLILAIAAASGLGYLLYNKIKKKGLKEVTTVKKLDEYDYVIYFDSSEVDNQSEEKFV